MKEIYVNATILLTIQVPEDATTDEVEEMVIDAISEVADANVINDLEWSEKSNPGNGGTIHL